MSTRRKWSALIKLFGVPVRIHPLLWIVFALSALTGYILEILVLFGVILIHELGHAAAASCLKWRIRQIRLLPFGGVAEVEEAGNIPVWQELIVVLAGPAQHLLMIGLALLCRTLGFWDDMWTDYFIRVNLMIGLFNLLPILPLDGGKVIQALISLWLPYYRTLHITYTVSLLLSAMLMAAAFGIWNAYGVDLNLFMIGIFLLIHNWFDYRNISYLFMRFLSSREERIRTWLHSGIALDPIMVSEQTPLRQVMQLLKRERYHMVYICNEHGKIKHALPEQRVLQAYLTRNEGQNRAIPFHFRYNRNKLNERRT